MDYYRSLDASTLDPEFPTIFELLASQQLSALINPYVRYILVHYAQAHPQYLIKIVNKYDELFLAIFGAVEYMHLSHWNSSFVEKFYGLKRTNRLPVFAPKARRHAGFKVEPLRILSKGQIWGSVAFAVLLPYLKEKAQVRYERLQARYAFKDIEEDRPEDSAPLTDHWKFQADVALLKWFPRTVFIGNTLDVMFTSIYLFRGSGPSSIADLLLNTRYSRISEYDHDAHEVYLNRGRFNRIKQTFELFGYVLPATLFTLKFLEWWNTSQFSSRLASSGPALPPPVADEPPQRWPACPICGKAEPENPATLETGVIYCYKCIWSFLQDLDHGKEPIARCPYTKKELLLTAWNSDTNQWDVGGIRRLMI